MIMARGLELAFPLKEVEWVMKMLFLTDLIVGVESLLEWAWLGLGFDYSECFENKEEGKTRRRLGFLWWPTGIDKVAYREKIKVAWMSLLI